jgi:hypothetical protein
VSLPLPLPLLLLLLLPQLLKPHPLPKGMPVMPLPQALAKLSAL